MKNSKYDIYSTESYMLFCILVLLFDSSSNIFKIFYTFNTRDCLRYDTCITLYQRNSRYMYDCISKSHFFFYIFIRRIKVSLYKNVHDTVTKLNIRYIIFSLRIYGNKNPPIPHLCQSKNISRCVLFSAYFFYDFLLGQHNT